MYTAGRILWQNVNVWTWLVRSAVRRCRPLPDCLQMTGLSARINARCDGHAERARDRRCLLTLKRLSMIERHKPSGRRLQQHYDDKATTQVALNVIRFWLEPRTRSALAAKFCDPSFLELKVRTRNVDIQVYAIYIPYTKLPLNNVNAFYKSTFIQWKHTHVYVYVYSPTVHIPCFLAYHL